MGIGYPDRSTLYNKKGKRRNEAGQKKRTDRLERRAARRDARPRGYLGQNKQPRPRDRPATTTAGGFVNPSSRNANFPPGASVLRDNMAPRSPAFASGAPLPFGQQTTGTQVTDPATAPLGDVTIDDLLKIFPQGLDHILRNNMAPVPTAQIPPTGGGVNPNDPATWINMLLGSKFAPQKQAAASPPVTFGGAGRGMGSGVGRFGSGQSF